MKKTVERSANLTPFRTDVASLERLVDDVCRNLFDGKCAMSLEVDYGNEVHDYDSFDEVKSAERPSSRSSKFNLRIRSADFDRRVTLHARYGRPSADAESDNAAWCAGAVAALQDFARRNRVWYSPIRLWVVWLALAGVSVLPIVFRMTLGYDPITGANFIIWGIVYVFMFVLFIRWEKLFPSAQLAFADEYGFLRRYQTEIVALGAALSALAAIATFVIAIAQR